MKNNRLILLALTLAAAPLANAAILLDRTGTINAQCCQFSALAIGWTMDREWTNVKIELDLHNGGDDDVVVLSDGVEQQAFTLFQGLTLGPGTYHLVYYSVSYEFPYFLSVAWDTSMDSETMGVGIVALPTLLEDANAPYRPASTWTPLGSRPDMIHITGTPSEESPVPEPSTASLLAVAGIAGAALRLRRLQRAQ